MLTPSTNNAPIFDHILNAEIKQIITNLLTFLDNQKYNDFYNLLNSKLDKFEIENTN